MKVRFIWADNYFENTTSSSTPKVGYNVGASLLTAHKNIELLATYNCNLRSNASSPCEFLALFEVNLRLPFFISHQYTHNSLTGFSTNFLLLKILILEKKLLFGFLKSR